MLRARSRVPSTKSKVLSTEGKAPRARYRGLTDAKVIEVALAAKKVFIHRRT